jgi:biopolymer transport protein ExbD
MLKRPRASAEIPTSSLADIAFLLLVFFLVTTTIDTDKGLGIVLPAEGEQKEVHKKNISNLLINAAGQVLYDDEIVSIRDIGNLTRLKIAENPKLIISVKADRNSKYQTYIEVIDQLKIANATRISIAEPD